MDIEAIRTFLEIVHQGSFSKAARTLELAQPTVSTRIQQLENEVGGALLRRGRQTTLTEVGETFLPYAQRLFETFIEGRETVRLVKTGQRGHVQIGTFSSLAATLLPDVIVAFRAKYPDVSLRIREGFNRDIVLGLQEGRLELGHVAWPWPLAPPDIAPILQFRESLVFVVAAGHPLAKYHGLKMKDLIALNIPFFHLGSGQLYRKLLRMIDLTEKPAIEVPLATAYELLLRGIGFALYTSSLVAQDLIAGRLAQITVADAEPDWRRIALVRNVHREKLSQTAENFVEVFRKEVERTKALTLI